MFESDPHAPAPQIATPEVLKLALLAEFDRLNATHFDGRFTVPIVDVSRRKTYGGYYQPGRHRIVVSWQAFQEHGWGESLNTFRHEVAHIVHINHSRAFWDLADALGATRKYAARPLQPRPSKRRRYVYECIACHRRITRASQIRRPTSCGSCDRAYNPQFALRLVRDSSKAAATPK